jgi:hypothetical protein
LFAKVFRDGLALLLKVAELLAKVARVRLLVVEE